MQLYFNKIEVGLRTDVPNASITELLVSDYQISREHIYPEKAKVIVKVYSIFKLAVNGEVNMTETSTID